MKIFDRISFKDLIPHLIAIIVVFLITLIFFAPSMLGNKVLSQHDVIQGRAVSHQAEEFEKTSEEEALWINSTFSGMPAYLNGADFSNIIITAGNYILRLGFGGPASVMIISGISFYILLLSFRVNPWIAVLGGVVFAINGFMIISYMAGHNSKALAISLMPLVLAGIHLTYDRNRWLGLLVTSLALGVEIYANHLQITYYLLFIVIAYGVYQLYSHVKQGFVKKFVLNSTILIGAAILALGMNFGKIYTLYEYSKYSTRGPSELTVQGESGGLDKDYVFNYSNGIFEPLVLFIPNIFGGSSSEQLSKTSAVALSLQNAGYRGVQLSNQLKSIPTYWGDQPLTAPYYAGVIPIFFFVLAFFVLPRKQTIWLASLVILGIVLSWGKNFESFNYLIYDYFPLYSKFRSVTFTIIISIFCIYLLGFQGLQQWLKSDNKKETLLKAIAICGGFALALFVIAGFFSYKGSIDAQLPDWFVTALREDRQTMLQKGAFKALTFILLSGAFMWFFIKDKISQKLLIAGLLILITIDMVIEGKRFVNEDSFTKQSTSIVKANEANQFIQSQAKPGERVLNLQNPFNEANTSYFHESIGGYHGAKMRRYQDLISSCLNNELSAIITILQDGKRSFNTPVLNMLNTKYFMAGATRNAVLPNNKAQGNAWFASNIQTVQSPDEEISATCGLSRNGAVIDKSRFTSDISVGQGTVQLEQKTPNELTYKVEASESGLVVFSEIYYPKGWSAKIDGEPVNIMRANYVLRALNIPEGSHTVIFRFAPNSYQLGKTVSQASSIIFLLLLIGTIGTNFLKKKG